ncbi:MAG TPA: HEAT repeat domain-containing protein [Terriglobia bacterium]|nr:HEAT repeat domain-containing protein [Terriglobia bacterium]
MALFLISLAFIIPQPQALADENYTAEFRTQKERYRLGEPVFCAFVFHNTGDRTLMFSYRFPTRAINPNLPGEPQFVIKDSAGGRLPDPAPHPCGGAKGSVVYGTVTLPPGRTHTELWLLDQWARFTRPGKYTLAARRRIALKSVDPATNRVSDKPVAYAVARDNLTLEILPSTPAERAAECERDGKLLTDPGAEGFAEAYLVATALPQPEFLDPLKTLARAPAKEHRWDPQQALEGLARLGTRTAWDAILDVARDSNAQDAVRAYAILLLGEKADRAYVPALVQLLPAAPESLRDDILRALGLFHSPRANQVLFDQLHSPRASDRVNAILGLRNLESKDVVPALLAMLDDPDDQVRQVANFALESLTGQKMKLAAGGAGQKSTQLAKSWHDWWLKHEGNFEPVRAPACHDW